MGEGEEKHARHDTQTHFLLIDLTAWSSVNQSLMRLTCFQSGCTEMLHCSKSVRDQDISGAQSTLEALLETHDEVAQGRYLITTWVAPICLCGNRHKHLTQSKCPDPRNEWEVPEGGEHMLQLYSRNSFTMERFQSVVCTSTLPQILVSKASPVPRFSTERWCLQDVGNHLQWMLRSI